MNTDNLLMWARERKLDFLFKDETQEYIAFANEGYDALGRGKSIIEAIKCAKANTLECRPVEIEKEKD